MRVHLLAPPQAPTTRAYGLDGFAQMTIRFATLLKRLNHQVFLYGHEANEAPCDEQIVCLGPQERAAMLGTTPYQAFTPEMTIPGCALFNKRAMQAITSRKQLGDVIATISGSAQLPVWNQHPELTFLEYSIGYRGVCAPFRVYQSHAWRHVVHGFSDLEIGREFDTVIPPFFDAASFPFCERPEPYVLYCGRLVDVKGLGRACQAAQAAGVPLKVIGHGDPSLITYGEYLGEVSEAERNTLLSQALAVLMPTQYFEPFGNVAAEAQLCGTPVLGPEYGAFTETIQHGMSGFRCATVDGYVGGIQRACGLDRAAIRARAQRLYSYEAAMASYTNYFERLALVPTVAGAAQGVTYAH